MDWIRTHKSLANVLGIIIVGTVGLAALFYTKWSAYTETQTSYADATQAKLALEKRALYPNPENVKALGDQVATYEVAVSKLGGTLLSLQAPLEPISDTEFQAKLKASTAEFRQSASERVPALGLPKAFAFGFDIYTNSLPKTPEAAKELSDYFDAVRAVSTAALETGIASIDVLERSELNVEKAVPVAPEPPPAVKGKAKTNTKPKKSKKAPVKELTKVLERRKLTLQLTCDQAPLQDFVNTLSSASKMAHYTIVRVIRVENERSDGPPKNSEDRSVTALSAPIPPAPEPMTDEEKAKAAALADLIVAPKAADPDAKAIMGIEMLKVYMEIDIVRFLEAPASTPAP
jgi:hypothetical protein